MATNVNYYNAIIAGGTADAMTATVVPAQTVLLMDILPLWVRVPGPNTTITPTLNINGAGAIPITLSDGSAVAAGDLEGTVILSKNSEQNRYELLNPATGVDNVIINTAAGWAADATVYGANKILVTSNALWPGTDQRKFKIADGVQAWSALDYPFTGLAQMISLNPSTGDNAISGSDGSAIMLLNTLKSSLQWDDGTDFSEAKVNAAGVDLIGTSITKNGSEIATQAYADGLVAGLLDDRGSYDASSNLFPATGGSGPAGAIKKGDIWYISVAGTLGGSAVTVGDSVRALVDTPGQTATNWSILETNIGYVPVNKAGDTMTGDLALNAETASRVAIIDASKKIKSADPATYPTLDELAFLKGVTSALQAQLDAKRMAVDFFVLGGNAIADSTTYYLGQTNAALVTATNQTGGVPLPAGTIKTVVVSVYNGATVGSSENITLGLLHGTNYATDSTIATDITFDANRQAVFDKDVNITVADECVALIKIVVPVMATNPNSLQIRVQLIYQ